MCNCGKPECSFCQGKHFVRGENGKLVRQTKVVTDLQDTLEKNNWGFPRKAGA